MPQGDVRRQFTEQSAPAADQHGDHRDGDVAQQASLDKGLHRLAAVDVQALAAVRGGAFQQFLQRAAVQPDRSGRACWQAGHAAAEHVDRHAAVRPFRKRGDLLERGAAHHQRIHGLHVRAIAAVLAGRHGLVGAVQPVQTAVLAGDVAVQAGRDE